MQSRRRVTEAPQRGIEAKESKESILSFASLEQHSCETESSP